MAPEIFQCQLYGIKVDMWALGVMYYKMLFGEYPYSPNCMCNDFGKGDREGKQYDFTRDFDMKLL